MATNGVIVAKTKPPWASGDNTGVDWKGYLVELRPAIPTEVEQLKEQQLSWL